MSEQTSWGKTENPLISPCKCDGTMKYIHALCLKEWLASKWTLKENGFSCSYYWKSLECELCKTTFPHKIKDNGISIRLTEISKPPGDYVVLESLNQGINKQIHVVSFLGSNEISIGWGHDCHVWVTDISVSRSHAILKKISEEFFLEDLNSKFGTLVQMKYPFELTEDPVMLQVGWSTMWMQL